jgi:hypothetical protein
MGDCDAGDATRSDDARGGARGCARPDFARQLDERLAKTPAESISVPDAVAAGYLERLRLGLGSPFRLIDSALADPLLTDSVRHVVAYAVLQRTLDGDTYHAPVAALSLAGATMAELPPAIASRHVAMIDSVVAAARDPRGGEMTVRQAYRLAAAAGSVGRRGPWLARRWPRLRAIARSPAPTSFVSWQPPAGIVWIRWGSFRCGDSSAASPSSDR